MRTVEAMKSELYNWQLQVQEILRHHLKKIGRKVTSAETFIGSMPDNGFYELVESIFLDDNEDVCFIVKEKEREIALSEVLSDGDFGCWQVFDLITDLEKLSAQFPIQNSES